MFLSVLTRWPAACLALCDYELLSMSSGCAVRCARTLWHFV